MQVRLRLSSAGETEALAVSEIAQMAPLVQPGVMPTLHVPKEQLFGLKPKRCGSGMLSRDPGDETRPPPYEGSSAQLLICDSLV